MEEKNVTRTEYSENTGVNVAEPALPPQKSEQSSEHCPEQSSVQSSEENSKYAAARRRAQAQRDEAIERIKRETHEAMLLEMDGIFADCGLVDPYTDSPINSKADFDRYKERRRAEISAMQDRAEEDSDKESVSALIEAELDGICALDCDIHSVDDIAAQPYAERLYQLIERGYQPLDAYRLAAMDKLIGHAAQRARLSAQTAAASKSHLRKTGGAGVGAASVPSEIRQSYLAFNPGATDAEISAHYNKYLQR